MATIEARGLRKTFGATIALDGFRMVVVLLLIGFPIALILAWAFDITPEGIRTSDKTAAETHLRRNVIILVATGVIVSAAAGFFLLPRVSASRIEKSIAVLPFENLSGDPDNAYFADGIQDDILTNLSKIGDLKVISRTSAMSYRSKGTHNVRDIGKALGVATLLEGSVRRIGNRVRVNVQLINANTDEHIWAEDYDRDLTDVFAIQTDLAQKIVYSLQAKLSPNEKARLDRLPTPDPNAYLVFVQAHDYANRPDGFRDDLLKAEQLYEQATKLDPNFAAAFAGLSMMESMAYHGFDSTPARREKARSAAKEALRLQPDLPEAHLALGFSYYYGDRDYERALAEFGIAKRDLPNEAQAYLAIGAIQRRQGKWPDSTANLEKAALLDPKNGSFLLNLAFSYTATRNFEAADKTLDRAIEAAPQSFFPRLLKGGLAISWKGDLSVFEKNLALLPPGTDPNGFATFGHCWVLTLQRRFPEALQVIQQFREETLTGFNTAPTPKASLEGLIYRFQGDNVQAQTAFEHARVVAEQLVSQSPEDAFRHAQLGLILAGLNRKEEAIKEGRRAVELLPESQDAFDGPGIAETLAQIYAWTGERDQAFSLLDHLLTIPNYFNVTILKLDPAWDPLRSDPRFQALIDKHEGQAMPPPAPVGRN